MRRIDAIRVAVELTANSPVVANCAATSRELAAGSRPAKPPVPARLDGTRDLGGVRPVATAPSPEGGGAGGRRGALDEPRQPLLDRVPLPPARPGDPPARQRLLRLDGGSPHPSRAG